MEHAFISNNYSEMFPLFFILSIIFAAFIFLTVTFIKVLLYCKILSKAGYCWALGLLTLIPVVGVIMAFFLAFADWPVCRELRSFKQQQKFQASINQQ
jgi:uncharacterized membrane protein YhaH (DUF805 family)